MTGVATARRYYNVFRHKPSGREEKRLMNRAVSCGLCGESLEADRRLYRAYFTHMAFDLLACHPACGDSEPELIEARRQDEETERVARSARFAAEASARSRLAVVTFAPLSVRPAGVGPSGTFSA